MREYCPTCFIIPPSSIYLTLSAWPFSVENENHCDFVKLREMLIRTNMEDLRDTTHTKHYELYRQARLEKVSDTNIPETRLTADSARSESILPAMLWLSRAG